MAQTPISNSQASLALTQYFPLQGVFPSRDGGGTGFFLGEIGTFAGNFDPAGGVGASGQLLSISQNTAVFSLIGTYYGGNGTTNFALPNLDGVAMIGDGQGPGLDPVSIGGQIGASTVTLSYAQTPPDIGGQRQPFDNYQPSLPITYEIALAGVYPSQGGGGARLDTLGMVMAFAGNFDAGGFAACDGQLMSIAQNTALFSLIGTTYGGDGITTFALPDLRGRDIIGASASDPVGTKVGQPTVSLSNAQAPDGLGGPVAPFDNREPSLSMEYLIATQGIFPPHDGGSQNFTTPFLGQIVNFAGNFVPGGWALCDGSLLSINQNQALFSLLGTQYGGNGITTFALPDLRDKTVVGASNSQPVGTASGANSVTITSAQLPSTTINGSYPTGYSLDPAYLTLRIGTAAIVGGAGVTATAAHPSIINNLGKVQAIANGVTLSDGGTITNGSASNHSALISGAIGVSLKGAGTVTNFGTIQGTGGTAISFNSPSARLIEQGNGVLDGTVAGGGGTLELAGNAGAGTLNGLGSSLKGFAAVTIDGHAGWSLSAASTVAANTVLNNSGTLDLLGQLTNNGQVNNLAGATLALQGDFGVANAGQFSNAGLLEKAAGAGTSIIRTDASSLTSGGTIDVETGTLELIGSTIGISGAIKGAGTIEFGTGAATLGAGSSVTTAGLTITGTGAHVTVARNLNYASTFSAGTNTELTIAASDVFTLTGSASFFRDTVDGAGRLATTGATTVGVVTLGGTAQWYNTGTLTQSSTFTIGDSAGDKAIFLNQAAGVFDLAGNAGIAIGTASTSTFTNQGLLAKTAGGMSAIAIAVANTGTLEATSGTLDLRQAVTGNGGTLKIDAGQRIQADAAVSAGQTVDFNGGGDRLVLTDAAHVAAKLQDFGAGDKLDLRQFDPAATTLSYVENAGHTAGTLTVTDGGLIAKIAFLGDYATAGFHAASDGAGGSYVTYTPPPVPMFSAAAFSQDHTADQHGSAAEPDGAHSVTADAANQTLTSSPGTDFFTSFGDNDTFAFGPQFGNDTITGFNAGSQAGHDILAFDDRLASVSGLAFQQTGQDALITVDAHDSILVKNAQVADLQHDIAFFHAGPSPI